MRHPARPTTPRYSLLLLAGMGASSLALGALGPARPSAPGWVQDEAPPGAGVQHSESCALCHSASDDATAMRDRSGASVAPFDLWQSTMMANSSRDPFWRAAVDAELSAAPEAAEAIAAKCLKCHAPMAERLGLDDHGTENALHVLECEGELGKLAADGVSCTVCHGMSPAGLGSDASFTAGFDLDPYRRLFGPHEEPFTGPMRVHTGFEPAYGSHVESSKLCGSCHTLVTHPLDAKGKGSDEAGRPFAGFHEQTPYLEWRNSVYSNETPDGEVIEPAPDESKTCQACHVPRSGADGRRLRTPLAHNPGGFDFPFLEPRSPFGRHLFVGGNTLVLGLLRDNAEALGATAPKEAFDATIAATRDQLEHRSAAVSISELRDGEDGVEFDVTIRNLTGHKLPTGHPSRRMWLEVVVEDGQGSRIFTSGLSDATGRMVNQSGEPLPSEAVGGAIEPHRTRITSPEETARYRAVMADTEGAPTHRLMRGASWYLDNRILPAGWSAEHPDAARAAPAGTGNDEDYASKSAQGSDRVTYVVTGAANPSEIRVRARLMYQSVSPRWVAEIAVFKTPAIERFLGMYEAADRRPVALATAAR